MKDARYFDNGHLVIFRREGGNAFHLRTKLEGKYVWRSLRTSLPIEIKVAESWTLEDLEAALKGQLCGQYLRARGARHGALLLVHQEPRVRGWTNPDGPGFLTFEQVVARLKSLAAEIARGGQEAPEAEVIVLDVSSCAAANDVGAAREGSTEAG